VSHVLSVNQAFTSPAKEDASKEETSILQGAVETCLVVCQAKDCEFEGKWRGYSLPQQIS